jgi:putative transposase
LAIHLYTDVVAYQKLDYIHRNPMAKHWRLVDDPCRYKYSTANFYNNGVKDFSFIRDLREEFGC